MELHCFASRSASRSYLLAIMPFWWCRDERVWHEMRGCVKVYKQFSVITAVFIKVEGACVLIGLVCLTARIWWKMHAKGTPILTAFAKPQMVQAVRKHWTSEIWNSRSVGPKTASLLYVLYILADSTLASIASRNMQVLMNSHLGS